LGGSLRWVRGDDPVNRSLPPSPSPSQRLMPGGGGDRDRIARGLRIWRGRLRRDLLGGGRRRGGRRDRRRLVVVRSDAPSCGRSNGPESSFTPAEVRPCGSPCRG